MYRIIDYLSYVRIRPSTVAAVSVGVAGLIVSCLTVLALIPLYPPTSHLNGISNDRIRSFQWSSQGFVISPVNATFISAPVNPTSFPVLASLIRTILVNMAKLPRSVAVQIDEAFIDTVDNQLTVTGHFIFSVFCKAICQQRILNAPIPTANGTQTLYNFTVDNLAYNIQLMIHSQNIVFEMRSASTAAEKYIDPIEMNISLQQTSSRRRRQSSLSSGQDSNSKLVQQLLALTRKSRNIPFIFNGLPSISQPGKGLQLFLTTQLKYPIYCTATCIDESINDLFATLLNPHKVSNIQYSSEGTTYTVSQLDMQSTGQSFPATMFKMEYSLDNVTNLNESIISDADSLTNLTNNIARSLSMGAGFEIIRASFSLVPKKSLKVIIRFLNEFSTCNRNCQLNKYKPLVDHLIPKDPVYIKGIFLVLVKPVIFTFGQPSNPSTTGATTTTTVTATTPTEATTSPTRRYDCGSVRPGRLVDRRFIEDEIYVMA